MPYNKINIYSTHHTHENDFTRDASIDHNRSTPPTWIPTLDLAGLTCDDEIDMDESAQRTKNVSDREKEEESVLFVRKQKPSFVFPSDTSLMNLDLMKSKHQIQVHYDDDSNITSVGSLRNCRTNNEQLPANGQASSNNQRQIGDNTISFSLGNHNLDRYMRFNEDDLEIIIQPENWDKIADESASRPEQRKSEDKRPSRSKERTKGAKLGSKENLSDITQEVIEVVVVNGNFKPESENSQPDEHEEGAQVDAEFNEKNIEPDALNEKPKPRVTFSFDENLTPRGSIKRYTPLKGDTSFQLQGVLKKRPPPSRVSSQSPSPDDVRRRERRLDSKAYKESVKFTSSSYHLAQHASLRVGFDQGIPVKHVHTTSADLEQKQTNVLQKPPASSSTRITLSMAAEKAAVGLPNRRTLSRGSNYSPAHTRGRMAYFRPADGIRPTGASHIRSKSTEDVSFHESKTKDGHSKSSKSRTNLPFTLRRCASSDHDLLAGSKQKPHKPKIAFGSFILPKEPVCHVRSNQIQFHDVDHKPVSPGSYVHTHTRRSPYAAPVQLFLKDGQKSEISRRPITAQARNATQPAMPAKELAQRHSAPSSYGQTREKSFHSSHGIRLSINHSPTRAQGMKTQASAPNASHESYLMRTTTTHPGAQMSRVRKNVEFGQPNRPNIATMNMISKRDKGASHHSFVTKLRDYCKEVS